MQPPTSNDQSQSVAGMPVPLAPPSAAGVALVPPAPQPPASPASYAQPTSGANPAAADDGDMIEKEWVTKAKQVLTTNVDNPYEQSLAFTRLKADYMQKRYGKDVKVDK